MLTNFCARTVRVVDEMTGEVLDEVRRAFDAYEAALLANDLEALDEWFWHDDRVVRFAFGAVQRGWAEVSAARRSLPEQTPPRTAVSVEIVALGPDAATVFAVFRLEGSGQVVHQSQVWGRVDGTWRVMAAHVSNASASS
jgi:ketosteroid isomerase-like protein